MISRYLLPKAPEKAPQLKCIYRISYKIAKKGKPLHDEFVLMIFKNTMFLKSCRALINCSNMKLRGNSFFQRVPQYVGAFKVKIWINNINGIGEFFRMFGAQEQDN